jgi:DNA-binding transcriptional LysR family regulator
MDFEKLKTFIVVAKTGSVTETSRKLFVSKSLVSRQLHELEQQLKTPLFHREQKKLILSQKGELLYEKGQQILMEVEATKSLLISSDNEIKGKLKITTTHALASVWLTEFLHLFIEKYPNIHLEIIASNQELNLSLREADVAIRPYSPNQNDLIQIHLWRWRLHLYASKKYIDQFGMPKKPVDLDHHRLIILGDTPTLYPNNYTQWPLILGTKLGSQRTPYLVINSVQGMFNLVKNGVGIGNFSDQSPLFLNQDSTNRLIPILKEKLFSDIDVYYIYPKQFQNVKTVIALGEFLKDHLNKSQ